MIKSFKHRGLKEFFENGSRAGILPHHAKKLQILLTALNIAKTEKDMNHVPLILKGSSIE